MILYKYYSDNVNSYKSIAMKGLWCHYPKNMNDPYECLGFSYRKISKNQIEIFRKALDESKNPTTKKLQTFSDNKIEEFINTQRKVFINQFAFCSLSERYDNIKMWSHYASSHTGFVIGFEFDDFNKNNIFQKVKYVNELPEFDVTKIIDIINTAKDEDVKYLLEDISIKTYDWEEEKEHRIWRKTPCYYHYKIENVKEIYFGVNTNIEIKAIVLKLLEDLPKDFQHYNMKFSNNPIKLEYE